VWIGNWGDGERDRELNEFLLEPVEALKLRATIYGVRYPQAALRKLAAAGFDYRGWLANFEAPVAYARHRVTVHVPRRPYARALPGIPTIRMFEALACGIPLISAPWRDCEHLLEPGEDYLVANDGTEMRKQLRTLLNDPERAAALAERGRRTIAARHTCAHRVDELLTLAGLLQARPKAATA
jgi:spore maturation protein CgeB